MKLLVDAETDKVIGASMCGPDSPEIVQVYVLLFVQLRKSQMLCCVCNCCNLIRKRTFRLNKTALA